MKLNYCTATVMVAPETHGENTVSVSYTCEKDGFTVRGCKYFKPMTCAGGLQCYNECEYFDHGCNNRFAIAACRKRANALIAKMLREDRAGSKKGTKK